MPQTPDNLHWIPADWPAPANIHAGTTTRIGGYSHGAYAAMNLAQHVGDNPDHVFRNRMVLREFLSLPGEPQWLEQTHSNRVIQPGRDRTHQAADGAYTSQPDLVCAILTADCLPLLLCNSAGTEIAAVHVGWRSFSKNIVHAALNMFTGKPENLLAWTGPCISALHYEVGDEVRSACLQIINNPDGAFTAGRPGHWFADLRKLVTQQLSELGVHRIYGGEYCTYTDNRHFYSYRRDGITGRVATLIWMHP
jgi:YfiH family protein